jgi:hypothetical protein
MYVLDRHVPLEPDETVRIPAELEHGGERLVVRSGDELLPGLGLCRAYTPSVEILWLAPVGRDDPYDLG